MSKTVLRDDQIDSMGRHMMGAFYRGSYSKDRLPKHAAVGGYVINMQSRNQGDRQGTHWVALAVLPKRSIYFDSYGVPPPTQIQDFAPDSNMLFWSRRMVQSLDSTKCGYFCLYFLSRIARGESLQQIRAHFNQGGSHLGANDRILRSAFRGQGLRR